MKLLMVSGDRAAVAGKMGPFAYTLESLTRHFDEIHVITPRPAHAAPVAIPGVHFHPSPWSLVRQPKWITQRGQHILSAAGPWVMTVHEYPPFYNGRGARKLHALTGVPYALEIHHIVGYPQPASRSERAGLLLSRWHLAYAARRATAVRTVNGDVQRILIGWGAPEQKVQVVPSFYLDAEALQLPPPVEHAYDVVIAGRMAPNKGIPDVLAAVAALPDVRLLVIGDGPLRQQMVQLARRLGIAPRVTFAGWLHDQEDVLRAMRSARVFVMNSRSEGGPRTALEAMALGMPVVVTKVGVMPDVVREGVNGLFTTGMPEDLAACVRRLLDDAPLRERLGLAARSVLRTFERTETIARYADFLRSLA